MATTKPRVKRQELSPAEKRLKPFQELGFEESGERGAEKYGDCPFCGGRNKFHVNTDTQKWSCKGGNCQQEGNLTTFLEAWYEKESEDSNPDWPAFAKERGIPASVMQAHGVIWSEFLGRWVIPTYNLNGRIGNLRMYNPRLTTRVKMRGMTSVDVELYGILELKDPKKKDLPVWVVEGEWDVMALRVMLRKAKVRAIVVGVPGAGTFKNYWADLLARREIITAYDNDGAGVKGTLRAYKNLAATVKSFRAVQWLDTLPEGFDVRDFLKHDGEFQNLLAMVDEYEPEDESLIQAKANTGVVENFPLLKDGNRPTFQETVEVYRSNLRMSKDMEDALRVVFAVIITTQIPGDPLWVHICAPPGGSKTEIVMSCSSVANTFSRSTVTVHSLVSGWKATGVDPSIIPRLYGGTFLLKDWTEILKLPVAQRNEMYSIFRGAYDGKVEKSFGNAVERIFEGYFNMVTGVTPELFADSSASLGERFLTFHMQQGTGWDVSEVVRAAFATVGREATIKGEIGLAAKTFLEYRIESSDIPKVPDEYRERLVNLAQLVSMLRAGITRDFTRERVLYRPQHEVGTRLVKQLHKLILGLGLQNTPPFIGEEEYRICARVAIDSCIGWNLDALRVLMAEDGLSTDDISERAKVPKQTMRDQLEELAMLGVLKKEKIERASIGRPAVKYYVAPIVSQFWHGAGLPNGRKSVKEPLKLKPYGRREIIKMSGALKTSQPKIRRKS